MDRDVIALQQIATRDDERCELGLRAEHEAGHARVRGIDITNDNGTLNLDVLGGNTNNPEAVGENRITGANAAHGGEATRILGIRHDEELGDVGDTVATGLATRKQRVRGATIGGRGTNREHTEVRRSVFTLDGEGRQTADVAHARLIVFVGRSRGLELVERNSERALAAEFSLDDVAAEVEERHAGHLTGIGSHRNRGARHQHLVIDVAVGGSDVLV